MSQYLLTPSNKAQCASPHQRQCSTYPRHNTADRSHNTTNSCHYRDNPLTESTTGGFCQKYHRQDNGRPDNNKSDEAPSKAVRIGVAGPHPFSYFGAEPLCLTQYCTQCRAWSVLPLLYRSGQVESWLGSQQVSSSTLVARITLLNWWRVFPDVFKSVQIEVYTYLDVYCILCVGVGWHWAASVGRDCSDNTHCNIFRLDNTHSNREEYKEYTQQ